MASEWTDEPENGMPDSGSTNDIVEKEEIVRDILGMQGSLRALLDRLATVRSEREKLKKDNDMLQTYIDNLTRSNAMAAANQK